jgi:heptosyltransferase-2
VSSSIGTPHLKNERVSEILIIQTAFLGDLLLSFPLIKEIKRIYPKAKITVLCRYRLGAILLKSGLVSRVIEVNKSGRGAWRDALQSLKNRRYDLALCPHESFRSSLIVFRLRSYIGVSIGFRHFWNSVFFSYRVDRAMELPESLRQLNLISILDAEIKKRLSLFESQQTRSGGQSASGLLPVPEWASMTLDRLFYIRDAFRGRGELGALSPSVKVLVKEWRLDSRRRPIAALAPGSVWNTKKWLESRYRELAAKLVAQGYDVLVHGASDERAICESIAHDLPNVRVVAGKLALWESAEMLALSDIVVCNDSGAMHMAACANVPTVSIFGPTVLEFGYRPWNNRAVVVQTELACRPCGAHGPQKCPIGTHACMVDISTEKVYLAVEDLIARNT